MTSDITVKREIGDSVRSQKESTQEIMIGRHRRSYRSEVRP